MTPEEIKMVSQLVEHVSSLQKTVTKLTMLVSVTVESVDALVDVLEKPNPPNDPAPQPLSRLREAFLKARNERIDQALVSIENSNPELAAHLRAWRDGEPHNL